MLTWVSGGTIDGTIGGISDRTSGVTSCGIIVGTSAQIAGYASALGLALELAQVMVEPEVDVDV